MDHKGFEFFLRCTCYCIIGLGIHIYSGGIYEYKTVYAMMLRIFVTLGFLLILFKYISKEYFG